MLAWQVSVFILFYAVVFPRVAKRFAFALLSFMSCLNNLGYVFIRSWTKTIRHSHVHVLSALCKYPRAGTPALCRYSGASAPALCKYPRASTHALCEYPRASIPTFYKYPPCKNPHASCSCPLSLSKVITLLCLYDTHLKTTLSFKTDADIPMARESAYRRGLEPNAAQNAFLAMTTAGISAVRQTEVRRAWKDGTARTARRSVFLKTTTN